MGKYIVKTIWHGYSRGTAVFEVEAESEEEAKEIWFEGTLINKQTVRDDTENEVTSVTPATPAA